MLFRSPLSVACIIKANTIVIYDVGVVIFYATNSGIDNYDASIIIYDARIMTPNFYKTVTLAA